PRWRARVGLVAGRLSGRGRRRRGAGRRDLLDALVDQQLRPPQLLDQSAARPGRLSRPARRHLGEDHRPPSNYALNFNTVDLSHSGGKCDGRPATLDLNLSNTGSPRRASRTIPLNTAGAVDVDVTILLTDQRYAFALTDVGVASALHGPGLSNSSSATF